MSQQINLFNPVFLQQKKIFSARTMATALAMLVLGVAALQLYGSSRVAAMQSQAEAGAAQLKKTEARLALAKAEFVPRVKNPAVEAELAEAQRQLAALRHVSGVLERRELGNTQGHAETFRALARQHVDGLWLTGVDIGSSGSEIGVRGRALDAGQVPGYLNRLTREPVMQGKAFGSMQIVGAAPAVAVAGGASAAPAYVEFSLSSTAEAPKP
ncbi:hypothetical protein [Massilia niabensis]|uniref:MSHA biogenesis protein MshI n=1 Tax=Massilia niabensis TaxID=544910 RepID=A0ABW0L4H6_9BURK